VTPDQAAAKAAEVLEEARYNSLDQRYVSNLVTIADAWMRLSVALASMPQALEPVMSVNMPDWVDVDAVAAALYARLGGTSPGKKPASVGYILAMSNADGTYHEICTNGSEPVETDMAEVRELYRRARDNRPGHLARFTVCKLVPVTAEEIGES
jgi:hypothetical protein